MTTSGPRHVWIDYNWALEGWRFIHAATGNPEPCGWHAGSAFEARERATREGFTVIDKPAYAAMTTTPDAPDLRQAAIAAAVTAFTEAPIGPIISDTSNLESAIEDAVAAAFATVAEGLYIADRGDGQPAVYDETRPPGRRCIIGPDVLSDRLWALLAAVIPNLEETP